MALKSRVVLLTSFLLFYDHSLAAMEKEKNESKSSEAVTFVRECPFIKETSLTKLASEVRQLDEEDSKQLLLSDSTQLRVSTLIYMFREKHYKIMITGPRGSGKTSIAKRIARLGAQKLDYIYIDASWIPRVNIYIDPSRESVKIQSVQRWLRLLCEFLRDRNEPLLLVIDNAKHLLAKNLLSKREEEYFGSLLDDFYQLINKFSLIAIDSLVYEGFISKSGYGLWILGYPDEHECRDLYVKKFAERLGGIQGPAVSEVVPWLHSWSHGDIINLIEELAKEEGPITLQVVIKAILTIRRGVF